MLRFRPPGQNRTLRRILFALIFFFLNCHIYLRFLHNATAEHDLSRAWDYNPDFAYPHVHGLGKIYIAANHWQSQKVLKPYWINGLLILVRLLGPENVFVSIYENGSWDETPKLLRELDAELGKLGVARKIITDPTTHREQIQAISAQGEDQPGWVWTFRQKMELRRIPLLAKHRNKLLEPLEELESKGKGGFNRILFLNDVVFAPADVISLLRTRGGNYTAACSIDFYKKQYYYDTFALRDIYGRSAASQRFPFFAGGDSRAAIMQGEPVPVKSCWNGMVAFDAAPFVREDEPLRFRGIDDSLAVKHLEGSEGCLIHADNAKYGEQSSQRSGVWINPKVRVGYSFEAYEYQRRYMYGWWEYIMSVPTRIGTSLLGLPWRKKVIPQRVKKWIEEGFLREEPGEFCLVDELHVLAENGWKHV